MKEMKNDAEFYAAQFLERVRNVWFEEVRVNCMQVGCPIKTNNVQQLWTLAGHVSGHLENISGSTGKFLDL